MNHKNILLFTGLAAALAVTVPLTSLATTDQKDTFNRGQTEMKQSDSDQYAKSYGKSSHQLRASSEIIGMDIMSATDEKVGHVEDLLIDMKSGKIVALVTSTGGLSGLVGQNSILSPKDVRFDDQQKFLQTELTKEQFALAPRYNEEDTSAFATVRSLEGSAGNPTKSTSQSPANKGEWDGKRDHSGANSLSAKNLVGMIIENTDGEKIGAIDKLYLDLEGGEVIGVVVSTGGFLGMGAHQNVLALSELNYDAVEDKISVGLDREQLRSTPTYKEDDSSWYTALRERSQTNAPQIAGIRKSTTTSNVRSTQPDAKSPAAFNQGNSSAEKKMTADIRNSIRDNNKMSSRANNVTIITQDKKVLLRGNVDSATEKTAVEDIAHDKAGIQNVTSELVVLSR